MRLVFCDTGVLTYRNTSTWLCIFPQVCRWWARTNGDHSAAQVHCCYRAQIWNMFFRTLFVRRPESCCWPRPTNYWEQVNRRTWGLLLRLTARRACRYFRRNLVPLYREVKPDASVSINGLCVNEIITLWNWNMMGGFSFESVRETALAFKIVKLAPSVFGLSAS